MKQTKEKSEELLQRLMESDSCAEYDNRNLPKDYDMILELLNDADAKIRDCINIWSSGQISTEQMREITENIARAITVLNLQFDQFKIE